MKDEHGRESPLPREWLPDAAAPDDAAEWDALSHRIVATAAPVRDGVDGEAELEWQHVLGSWLTPAVALAAAAAVLVFAAGLARPVGPGQPSLPLAVLAADGDPAALWQSLGVAADPVLGLIALQGLAR